jgi:hypothetical protein
MPRGAFGFGGQGFLKIPGVDMNFACSDLLLRGALKAQFTHAEAALDPERRTEDAAGHRPGGIEIAEAGPRVESRARLLIAKILKDLAAGLIERAAGWIAGKLRRKPRDRCFGTAKDGSGSIRIGDHERGESVAQAGHVEL